MVKKIKAKGKDLPQSLPFQRKDAESRRGAKNSSVDSTSQDYTLAFQTPLLRGGLEEVYKVAST